MVRLNSGSNSTESSASSPGWSPTSGCWAKLCETERIRPAAAIAIQIRCRNFVIQDSPSSNTAQCLHGLPSHWNHQISGMRDGKQSRYPAGMLSILASYRLLREGPESSLRRQPQPQAIGQGGHGADPAEPKYEEPDQALRQRLRFLLS